MAVGITSAVHGDILIDEVVTQPADKNYFSVHDFSDLDAIVDMYGHPYCTKIIKGITYLINI